MAFPPEFSDSLEYANRYDLDLLDIYLEGDSRNPMFFSVEKLPKYLSLGKHYFHISILNDSNQPYRLKPNTKLSFEFKSKNNVVIKSETTNIDLRLGLAVCFVHVFNDPLRTYKEAEDGMGTLTIVGELENKQNTPSENLIPQSYLGKENYRCIFPVEIRKDLPNLSPILFQSIPNIQANTTFSESMELDTGDLNYQRSYLNISASHLTTFGGKVDKIELSYLQQKSKNTEHTVFTTYPLSSSKYEITSTLSGGLNPISDLQKFPLPREIRRNQAVDFKLRFLNADGLYAQDITKNNVAVEITGSLSHISGSPLILETEDNLITGSGKLIFGDSTQDGVIAEFNKVSESVKFVHIKAGKRYDIKEFGGLEGGFEKGGKVDSHKFLGKISGSAILAGKDHRLVEATGSTIGGGQNNRVSASSIASVLSGKDNVIVKSDNANILGGIGNIIQSASEGSAILSGESNKITEVVDSVILGGEGNNLGRAGGATTNNKNNIIGGLDNEIINAKSTTILGGDTNKMTFANHGVFSGFANTIVGGTQNTITGSSNEGQLTGATIIGASACKMTGDGNMFSVIVGGLANAITTGSLSKFGSGIVGGLGNHIKSSVNSGIYNSISCTVTHDRSTIIGMSAKSSDADDTVYVQNLDVAGTASFGRIESTTISSSVVYSSGSNIFGDAQSDLHTFNGIISSSSDIHLYDGDSTGNPLIKLHHAAGSDEGILDIYSNGIVNARFTTEPNITSASFLTGAGGLAIGQSTNPTAGPGGLTVVGHISASGNVTAASTSTASFGYGTFTNVNIDDDLYIANKIQHTGDSNTYIEFGDDFVKHYAGNINMLYLHEAGVDELVINDGAVDMNLLVKSNNDTHAIFLDGGSDSLYLLSGSNGNVAIGAASTGSSKLQVDGDITTTHITASGNISSSGTLIANAITLPNDSISGDLVSGGTIGTTTITALAGNLSLGDNNITNVGDITLDSITDDATGNTLITLNGTQIAMEVAGTSNQTLKETSYKIEVPITASGNISSSGAIKGNSYEIQGKSLAALDSDTELTLAYGVTDGTGLGKINLGRTNATPQIFTNGAITASGDISSSGTIYANAFEPQSISGSATSTGSFGHLFVGGNVGIGTLSPGEELEVVGDISASGVVSATKLQNISNINYSDGSAGDIDLSSGVFQLRSTNNGAQGLKLYGGAVGSASPYIDTDTFTSFLLKVAGTTIANVKSTGIISNLPFTASGDISASGKLIGTGVHFDDMGDPLIPAISAVANRVTISSSNDIVYDSNDDHTFRHQGTTIAQIQGDEAIMNVLGSINTSGNITASKALITGSLKVGPDNVDVSNVEMEVGYSENLIGEHIKSGSRINVTSDSFASSSLFLYSANKGWEIATGKLTGMFEAGALVFRVNGSTTANPPLKLSGGGHVGIGMDKDVVPAKTLTVEGDISASGDIYLPDQSKLAFDTRGHVSASSILNIYGESIELEAATDTHILIKEGGNEYVRFDGGNQRVGIGTTSPSKKLEVEGDISASGIFYGKQKDIKNSAFFLSSNHSSTNFIPIAGSLTESTVDQYFSFLIAPYNGRLVKVLARTVTGDPGTVTIGFHTGSGALNASALESTPVQVINLGSTVDDTVYTFNFSSSLSSFNETDLIGISWSQTNGVSTSCTVTSVWEYDIDD